jgi:hypothetical protein
MFWTILGTVKATSQFASFIAGPLTTLLFFSDRSLLPQAGFLGGFWYPTFLPHPWRNGGGQYQVPEFVETIVDVLCLIAITLACQNELAAIIDPSAIELNQPRADIVRN